MLTLLCAWTGSSKARSSAIRPIKQSTTFELVVNLRTAKALVIMIPESILQQFDEVIR